MGKVQKVTLYIAGYSELDGSGQKDGLAHLNGALYHEPVHYNIVDVETIDVGDPYTKDNHPINKAPWGDSKGISEFWQKHSK